MSAHHDGAESSNENVLQKVLSRVRTGLSRAESRKARQAENDTYDSGLDETEPWTDLPDFTALKGHDGSGNGPQRERKLGVTWNNLTIRGVGADACFNESVLSQFLPGKLKGSPKAAESTMKVIIDSSSGCVKPGEMLLVLGRPGAGCTSLLRVLGNQRKGFAEIDGEVKYGSMDHKDAEQYRGQIVMNTEREIFFPALSVRQTIDFATRLKSPNYLPTGFSTQEEARVATRDFFLKLLGIHHTLDTKVGDEYIRGVSGGERKRVSIVETMTTRASIYCWDNPTRGLDASTALQYTKAIRTMTDVFGLASIVTVYQAGNGIYDLFDKTLVLDKGKQLYYGPLTQARPFMEDLGFICADGANVADFLTGVSVSTERQTRPGSEAESLVTAEAIRSKYLASTIKTTMDRELSYPTTQAAQEHTEDFKLAVKDEKRPSLLMSRLPVTVGFRDQLKATVQRQYAMTSGDLTTLFIKQGVNMVQALTAGSLFYNAPDHSAGLFIKSGSIFVALLFNALLAQSEVTDSFSGRPVLSRHKSFAFYHPAAFCFSQIIVDLPILLFQISVFSLIIYFMTGLTMDAKSFFLFWFIVLSSTMAMTALFRAIGAAFPNFDAASKASGLLVSSLLLYNGYMISKREMHPWFVWIYWIDPIAYAYNALLSNEFYGKVIPCVGPNLVPSGPQYSSAINSACTGVRGAQRGASFVTGEQYLESLSYNYSNMARNIVIIWVWWIFYVFLTVVFTSAWKDTASQSDILLVPRHLRKKADQDLPEDEESQTREKPVFSSGSSTTNDTQGEGNQLIQNTSVFTWRNLSYTIETPDGPRVLLNDVNGWVKPGMLGALMGSSGAGKTTLMDVLAQRKTDGTIKGSVLVDGRPLSVSFQRSAGYCEQQDVHEPLATVREALEFSALLRQSRTIPREEKLRYVDTIIDLLEMHDIEGCLIGGSDGAGLSVEQKKRLTIGVELVAKPTILIFLDEPTSGLDGQSAFNIIRFLKKLSSAGQAILVTIHQPSAQLFYQFDTLLLLAKGGNTIYFGDIGENASTVKEYFERHNAPCPPNANPAEHMIDVVTGHSKDWSKVWKESPEHERMITELDRLVTDAANAPEGTSTDGHEFAVSLGEQIKIVTVRMATALWRNTEYANNKFMLHIILGLFVGFSFWMIGDSVGDLQLRLFAVFNLIFVAPGVIAQLQPLFLQKRDIYETREKKAKMYSWIAFVTAMIVAEIPYLIVCAVLYFFCFYYTVGFPSGSDSAGPFFFILLMYEFIYTGIGQGIAAYAPNAVAATLINPLIIFTLVGFCGVIVPYSQMQDFWKYWLYYINPFNYLTSSLLVFVTHDVQITCKESEFAVFDPIGNQTCGEYLDTYLRTSGSSANLTNPEATLGCRVCQYKTGQDFLRTINLPEFYYGWRNLGIIGLFVFSGYGCVYLLMKLRTKKTKKAEGS